MHAFSAIPDMTVDKKAGIATTAVFLGKQKTLLFILANWLVFSLLCLYYFGVLGSLGWIPFGIALYILLAHKKTEDFYWYFPYSIPALGFLAFWYILLSRFGWTQLWQSSGLL
jgi:4-hydroxybenzoate polyprenyltransferase